VDVTELMVGQSIRVSDITLPDLQLMDSPRDVLVTVAITRAVPAGETGTTGAEKETKTE
jgi:hypothetical protein